MSQRSGAGRAARRAVVGVALAALLALAAAARLHPYLALDLAATRAVQTLPSSLGFVLIAISWLGYAPQSYALAGVIVMALALAGRRREATLALFAAAVVAAGNLVKILVQRPRPDPALVQVREALAPWGFPSGHVVTFTAFAGFLTFLSRAHTRDDRGARIAALALFLALDALMGLSRIYVGDHWLTDVIGGYLLGGLWLALTIAIFHRWVGPVPGASRTGALAMAALLAVMASSRHATAGTADTGAGAATPALAAGSARPGLPPDSVRVVGRPGRRVGAAPQPAPADTVGMDDLRATTAPPWNPPRPIPRRRTWEEIVQGPEHLATLPLTGFGELTERGLFWIEQSGRIPLTPRVTAREHHDRTLTLGPPGLGDFAGFGASVEARQPFLPGRLRTALDLRAAASTHKYNAVRVSLVGRPFALEAGDAWRAQDRFYGLGDDASTATLTAFATRTQYARASLRAEWDRRANGRPRRSVEVWAGPRRVETRSGREHDRVSFHVVFPALGAPIVDRPIEHFASGARLSADWRSGQPHWTRGGRALLAAERFDDPVKALAIGTARPEGARFTRYTAEGEVGASLGRDPRTLRLMLRLVRQEVQARSERFLISDYSTLGGQGGIRGFLPGRFHDRDLLLERLTYVFPVSRRLEMALSSSLGGVYHDLWHDPKPGSLRHSLGIALRVRSPSGPVALLGVDISSEAVRIGYGIGGIE